MKSTYRHLAIMMLPAALMLGGCEGDLAVPPVPVPDGLRNEAGQIGQGTPDIPLTVYQASIGTLPEGMEKAWVSGYIVGSVNSDIAAFINEETVEWRAPFSKKSNILLAADPECRDLSKVIPVGFTFGYETRTDLNLADNPNMLGQLISIYGTTNVKYFGEYGMKESTFYMLGNKGIPVIENRFEVFDQPLTDGIYTLYTDGYIAHIIKENPKNEGYLYAYSAYNHQGIIESKGPADYYDFTFARIGEGEYFTIRQSDGYYLCRKPKSSTNWSGLSLISELPMEDPTDSEEKKTEKEEIRKGAYWSIYKNDDGTFTIKNVLLGTSMQFDTQYSSFGLYTGSAKAFPYIVKRI